MPAQSRGPTNPYYYGRAEDIDPTYLALIQILQQMMANVNRPTGERGPGGGYNPFAWMDEGGLSPDQKRLADEQMQAIERQQAMNWNLNNRGQSGMAPEQPMPGMDELMAMLSSMQQGKSGGDPGLIEFTIPGGTSGATSDTIFGNAGLPANPSNWADILSGAPGVGESRDTYVNRAGVTTKPGAAPTDPSLASIHDMYTGKGEGMPSAGVGSPTAAADEILFGKGTPPPVPAEMQALIEEASDLALILGIPTGELEKQKLVWARLKPERMRAVVKKLQDQADKKLSWSGVNPEDLTLTD